MQLLPLLFLSCLIIYVHRFFTSLFISKTPIAILFSVLIDFLHMEFFSEYFISIRDI